MKTYTLQEIHNRFGYNVPKTIVKTGPDKFKLVKTVDSWETLDNEGTIKSFRSDVDGNIYEPISDPNGKYLPYTVWQYYKQI